jgi:broad specificity phosphatase PhoE
MNGRSEAPLSDLGRRQAIKLAAVLAEGTSVAALYSSPQARARETASACAGALRLPVHDRAGLCEIDCGIVDGLPIDEVKCRFPLLWRRNERHDDDAFRWPGGESYSELRHRALETVHSIAAAHAGSTVVVITHAGIVSQICGWLTGLPPSRWDCWRPGHCGITEVLWGASSAALGGFDDATARQTEHRRRSS